MNTLKAMVFVGAFGLLVSWVVDLPGKAEAQAGQPQPKCARLDEIMTWLKEEYAEKPVSFGLQSNGFLLQVFSSEGGTWTLVSTNPQGIGCIVAMGRGWENLPLPSSDPMA